MRAASLASFVACLLLLGFTVTYAQSNVTVTKIAEYDDPLVELPPPVSGCAIGNTGPAVGFVAFDWVPLSLGLVALLVRPRLDCPQLRAGFEVSSVHLLMRVAGTCETSLNGMEMESIPFGSCPQPDPPQSPTSPRCSFGDAVLQFPEAGVYDVEIPMMCPCALAFHNYFLILLFEWTQCLGSGGFAELGYSSGSTCQWFARVNLNTWWDPGFPGDLVWYAEASSCESPISSSRESWGSVKARFER